ncbi:MAG: hypothetical protein WBC63_10330 [Candidatus Bipolaricaulia bacterium]
MGEGVSEEAKANFERVIAILRRWEAEDGCRSAIDKSVEEVEPSDGAPSE